MFLYKFKAMDTNTNLIESNIKASSIEEAKQTILERGFTLIKIEQAKGIRNIEINLFKRINVQDIILFCRELSIIIKSGISLTIGLDILRKQSTNTLKEAMHGICNEVQKGKNLSTAMRDGEIKFPELLTRMISTGEFSGNLDDVLENMGNYYERESYIKQKIRGAMVYPIILILTAIVLVAFFANFILPSMTELMAGQSLPLITKVTIAVAKLLGSKYNIMFIAILVITIILVKKLTPADKYRKVRDAIFVKIPVVGPTIKCMITVRFTRTLWLLLKSGLDIVNVLEILKKSISNSVAEKHIEYALEGVKRGEKLGTMLNSSNFFDPLIVHMISVGEETGELEKILDEVTKFYEKRLEIRVEKLISLVEPVFTLIIGVFIAFIIFAMALPMFSMVGNMNGAESGLE